MLDGCFSVSLSYISLRALSRSVAKPETSADIWIAYQRVNTITSIQTGCKQSQHEKDKMWYNVFRSEACRGGLKQVPIYAIRNIEWLNFCLYGWWWSSWVSIDNSIISTCQRQHVTSILPRDLWFVCDPHCILSAPLRSLEPSDAYLMRSGDHIKCLPENNGA